MARNAATTGQGFLAHRSKEMAKVLKTTRLVTMDECPWLDADLPKGTMVWSYSGATYGVVSPCGVAVTAKAAESPCFELPSDALKETCG